ncbi:MAG TPA: hypothetical protein VI278_03960 [Nitrososphaeraceae archaeon]|jgi:hypothetical protein
MGDNKASQNSGAVAKKLANMGKQLVSLLKPLTTSVGRKAKDMGKEEGKKLEPSVKKIASTGTKKAKDMGKDIGTKSKPLLNELATMINVEANKTIEQTKQAIKDDMEATKASNLAKSSEELPPDIILKRVNLNERLARELKNELGIDCEAVEVNSLAIENKPSYYSYRLPMSPKIVTNRGCIKVKGKRFGLIQIIQRN